MAYILLTVVLIVAIGLIVYGVYNWIEKLVDGPSKDGKLTGDILKAIHDEAKIGKNKTITTNKVSKTLLMEKFNLKPLQLKSYLNILLKYGIVNEGKDSVTITPFGTEFRERVGTIYGKLDNKGK